MGKPEIKSRILSLKKTKDVVILAHNYQLPEIYDVADFVGDSFELAIKARETQAKTIVFCGVHFMAESAKILNPEKKVVIPDLNAGCFLADTVDAVSLREKKKEHPDAAVACYINSTAEVKAECDVCVTSANAAKVVRGLSAKKIIFVPDQHLGGWVAEQVPEKEIILWGGNCYVHARILLKNVEEAQKNYPEAMTIAHPECPKEIREKADEVLGTGGMVRYVKESPAKQFLIATENGMLERLKREAPGKKFFALCGECLNMKKITLEKVLSSLEKDLFEIEVSDQIAEKAKLALEKMIELTKA